VDPYANISMMVANLQSRRLEGTPCGIQREAGGTHESPKLSDEVAINCARLVKRISGLFDSADGLGWGEEKQKGKKCSPREDVRTVGLDLERGESAIERGCKVG
jgi:hypothetical protein